MPRRAKATAEDSGKAKASEIEKQIAPSKLKNLLKAAKATYADAQELAGSLGQKIAHAVEHEHLHRKAFNTLKMMDRMEPEKLASFWDTLQHYVEVSGIGARAASAPGFDLEASDTDDDDSEGYGDEPGFAEPVGEAIH